VVVKAFLVVLALTFVLFFGISDVIRRITGKDYILKIGNVKINPFEFKNEKARRLGLLRGRVQDLDDKNLTASILHQLIWENIIDQASMDYGLVISDEIMKKYISGMKMFRDKEGRFDSRLLRNFLQSIRVPETMFLESSKKSIQESLIKYPFSYISLETEQDIYRKAQQERRSLVTVDLNPALFKITDNPDTEVLERFYSANPELFMEEESRSLRILTFSEASVAKNVQVSDEELLDAYERAPERADRSFDDIKEELRANMKQDRVLSAVNEKTRVIEDALMAGETIEDVCGKHGLAIVTVDHVTANNNSAESSRVLSVPYGGDVLSVAFSLDEGTDSSFSEGQDEKNHKLFWLVHLDKITPRHIMDFEKSTKRILEEWVKKERFESATKKALELIEKIKGGEILARLAAKNKYKITEIPAFDRTGTVEEHPQQPGTKGKDKQKGQQDPRQKKIMEVVCEDAFSMGVQEANSVTIDGHIVVYQVKTISYPKDIEKKETSQSNQRLLGEVVNDLFQQLVGHLSKKYKVSCNHELLKEINDDIDQNILDEIF
jgi:hypothetical protein